MKKNDLGTLLLATVPFLGMTACDDPFEAFLERVPDEPTEVSLTELRTGPLGSAAAFDATNARTVRVDQTNQWDVAYVLDSQGRPQLSPFGAVTDSVSAAGIQAVAVTFEELLEAPAEGYLVDTAVPVAEGDVVVVRSRQDPAAFTQCRRFAKLQVLEIGASNETILFRFLANPNCEDVVLAPGQRGDF